MKNCVTIIVLCLLGIGCDQFFTRSFGGTTQIDLPCGQKLVMVTWKETYLWYLTRKMRDDENPETHSFKESSTLGVAEGVVIIKECK